MTVKRLFAIGLIFALTAVAWMILGASLWVRSEVKNDLGWRVEERYGGPRTQRVPLISKAESPGTVVQPESSDIRVDIQLDPRQMGLLWYSTYKVGFDGTYEITNDGDAAAAYVVTLPGDGVNQVQFDEFSFGEEDATGDEGTSFRMTVPAKSSKKFHLKYRSAGMDSWRYAYGPDLEHIKNFNLVINTDFKDVDFTTLSPDDKKETDAGWALTWSRTSTRAQNFTVTLDMPEKQNPGPLVSRITFFAPVSLLFFFLVILVISVMKGVEIHPMNYFFIAGAFFAFALLLAYLVDHVDVQVSFFISAAVSVFLVVSYLRLVTGMKFAVTYAGACQLVFLVGFSYAFFYKGFAGLAVTIGSIITLFVLMQVTGHVKWSEVFRGKPDKHPPVKPPAAKPWTPPPPDLPNAGN